MSMELDLYEEMGRRLKAAREAAGLSVDELEKQLVERLSVNAMEEELAEQSINPEFIGQLMDQVEDFLSERKVSAVLGDDNTVVLQGESYDDLAERFRETCKNWGIQDVEDDPFMCDSEFCVYADTKGICRCKMLTGNDPIMNDQDGCLSSIPVGIA